VRDIVPIAPVPDTRKHEKMRHRTKCKAYCLGIGSDTVSDNGSESSDDFDKPPRLVLATIDTTYKEFRISPWHYANESVL